MTTEKKPDEQECDRPDPHTTDATPLATGVWVTEATGFASVPPRAQSDLRDAKDAEEETTGKDAEPRIEKYRER